MAVETAVKKQPVAANDESATNDFGWPFEKAAVATVDEIRHADELRSRLRERYRRLRTTSSGPWCVGID